MYFSALYSDDVGNANVTIQNRQFSDTINTPGYDPTSTPDHNDQAPDHANHTLTPKSIALDETLTAGNAKFSSPLPTNLPPPPQFGNEAITSTPHKPPPYKQAISRSSLVVSSFNSNLSSSNNNNSAVITYNQSMPSNRQTTVHQPLIFVNDQERNDTSDSDRTTPSPTTHLLVLEDHISEGPESVQHNTQYNFYKHQLKASAKKVEPVKVTFV